MRWLHTLIILLMATILFIDAMECGASDWNVPSGNWSDGTNWTDGEPVYSSSNSGPMAAIHNGGTATIDQDGEGCGGLRVDNASGIEMTGGTLRTALSGSSIAESDYRSGGEFIGRGCWGPDGPVNDAGSFFHQSGGTNTIGDGYFGIGASNYIPNLVVGLSWGGGSAIGSYELSGSGSLSAPSEGIGCNFSAPASPGNAYGHFIHTGGTNECGLLVIGGSEFPAAANATGVYDLSGTGQLTAFDEHIGMGGHGTFNQSGGTNTLTGDLCVSTGWSSPGPFSHVVAGIGRYNLSDGELTVWWREVIGGHFTQTGGTNTSKQMDVCIGAESADEGVYSLLGGTLVMPKGAPTSGAMIAVGGYGHISGDFTYGSFNLGDAVGTGSIVEYTVEGGSGLGACLEIARSADNPYGGIFQGWGVVALTGTLTNNGRVVGKGYGTDRTLDLSSFTAVVNTTDAASGYKHGWFAEDHGKLALPSISVAVGAGAYNWGESADDATIDLVNSVRMSFADVSAGGEFSIDLLASNRGEVPALPGVSFIGAWDFRPPEGFDFSTVDLTFRYDDVLAGELGINENTLRVYHLTGGEWVDVTGGLDAANNWIFANGMTSFSLYAVGGAPVPEPATLALLLAFGLTCAVYVRRTLQTLE